mmetsp:Transcript_21439/g.36630  ORF Transcript_21439/g.36630 Transcript_21439/m.36630 type:complete len:122 (-) Transcript_21439:763-1128(-)
MGGHCVTASHASALRRPTSPLSGPTDGKAMGLTPTSSVPETGSVRVMKLSTSFTLHFIAALCSSATAPRSTETSSRASLASLLTCQQPAPHRLFARARGHTCFAQCGDHALPSGAPGQRVG